MTKPVDAVGARPRSWRYQATGMSGSSSWAVVERWSRGHASAAAAFAVNPGEQLPRWPRAP